MKKTLMRMRLVVVENRVSSMLEPWKLLYHLLSVVCEGKRVRYILVELGG